jgi:hypothetical protein
MWTIAGKRARGSPAPRAANHAILGRESGDSNGLRRHSRAAGPGKRPALASAAKAEAARLENGRRRRDASTPIPTLPSVLKLTKQMFETAGAIRRKWLRP